MKSCFNTRFESFTTALKKFLVKALLCILTPLPLSVRQFLGAQVGIIIGKLPLSEKRIARKQLTLMLYNKEEQAPLIPGPMFTSLGITLFESLNLKPILDNHEHFIECPDWELVQELRAKSTGIVALTAHFGNWELLAAYVAKRNIPLTVIGKPSDRDYLQEELSALRQQNGVKTIWRDGNSLAREIIKDLKNGNVIAALIDQDTNVQSIPVPFFGYPAYTPSALVRLAQRCNAPLVAAFITRNRNNTFTVRVHHLAQKESTEATLLAYHALLEQQIKATPEQWVWFHKRWRTVATGRRSSAEYEAWLDSQIARL
jgi:Kdo2-lipid IVA lauroyltransferase/acyltransferase